MDPRLPEWLPWSFFRSPSWRWVRASWLHRCGRRTSPRIDDDWVRRARRFLAANPDSVPNPRKRRKCADPAVASAVGLAREETPHRRWKVEALLLTSEPLEAIADAVGLSVEAVEAYALLFYDVRPYPSAVDWVMAQGVGTSVWQGFGGLTLGSLWKYAALSGGPHLLEVVIAITMNEPLPAWLRASFADAEHPAYEEARFRLKAKLAIIALTAGSPEDLRPVVEVREQLRRLDRQIAGTPDDKSGLLPVLEGFLRSVGRRSLPDARAAAEGPRTGERTSGLRGTNGATPEVSVSSLQEASS